MAEEPKKPSVHELLQAALQRRQAQGLKAAADPDAEAKKAESEATARNDLEQARDLIARNLNPFDSRKVLNPDGSEQKALNQLLDTVLAECELKDPVYTWTTFKERAGDYLSTQRHDSHLIARATVPYGARPQKPSAENNFQADPHGVSTSGAQVLHQQRAGMRKHLFSDNETGYAADLNRAWDKLCKTYSLSGRDMNLIYAQARDSSKMEHLYQTSIKQLYSNRGSTQALGVYFAYVKANPDAYFSTLQAFAKLAPTQEATQEFETLKQSIIDALEPLKPLPPRGQTLSK